MASITIRNLDEAAKRALRERAARNGRSMEEEARLLLAADAGLAPGPDADTGTGQRNAAVRGDSGPDGLAGFAGAGKTVLLILCGGVAAYKSLDLIRRLRERGVTVRCVMTAAARQFVTEMAVGAICGGTVFHDLWDRQAEHDIGHIRLAREADLIVIAPATADFLAKMANGLADDLASAVLLAARRPVLAAPAMNPAMWANPATQRNVRRLADDGVHFVGPERGEMAESGEAGLGRMAEPMAIVARVGALLDTRPRPLSGRKALVTSGPTHEPIDPVRYIANRSSGRQGHAIAAALAELGAEVTLVSGPVGIADPSGVTAVHVETARQMQAAAEAALPVDLAVMVAAVADWRTADSAECKIKKQPGGEPPMLRMTENPDILHGIGHHPARPALVVGFAAETNDVIDNAKAKLARKGADWIVANDVSAEGGAMGGVRNTVHLVSTEGVEDWPDLPKDEVARRLARRVAEWFARREKA